jgi:hypothetical protein
MITKYEDRYCLFLDILGFKEIVEDSVRPGSGSRATKRGRQGSGIYFSLREIAQILSYKMVVVGKRGRQSLSSRRVTQFSDSVVVSYLASEYGSLSSVLNDVVNLQISLINRRILVRGGITRGKLYHADDFVFGPALVEAAELEKGAMYPRVILDRELLRDSLTAKGATGSPRYEIVSRDLDGMYFVDYFGVNPDLFNDWSEMVEYLISLREVVKGIANKTSVSLRLKHSWLRAKYNDVAEPLHRSRYEIFCGHVVPEDEEDHILNVTPFR